MVVSTGTADEGDDDRSSWSSGESLGSVKIPDGDDGADDDHDDDNDNDNDERAAQAQENNRRRWLLNMGIAVLAVIFLAFVAIRTMNGDDGTPTTLVQASGTGVERPGEAKTADKIESEPELQPELVFKQTVKNAKPQQAAKDTKPKQVVKDRPKPKAVAEVEKCGEGSQSSSCVKVENKARPAKPKNNLSRWATTNDYPSRALSQEREGTTSFRVTVGLDGKVTDCKVTVSSGHGDLDAATCNNVKRRARFDPALDSAGNPTSGFYANRVTWRIPKE